MYQVVWERNNVKGEMGTRTIKNNNRGIPFLLVRILNLISAIPIYAHACSIGCVNVVRFNCDGTLLASASDDRCIMIWEQRCVWVQMLVLY